MGGGGGGSTRSRAQLRPVKKAYPKPGNKAGEQHALSMSRGHMACQPAQELPFSRTTPGFEFPLSYWVKAQTPASLVDFCP